MIVMFKVAMVMIVRHLEMLPGTKTARPLELDKDHGFAWIQGGLWANIKKRDIWNIKSIWHIKDDFNIEDKEKNMYVIYQLFQINKHSIQIGSLTIWYTVWSINEIQDSMYL